MNIKLVSALPKMADEVYKRLNADEYKGKTLIWFGYTLQLSVIQKELMKRGIRIDFAVDNERSKWGLNPLGILECYPPDCLKEHTDSGIVIISSIYSADIKSQVVKYGYSDDRIICFKSPDDYAKEIKKEYFPELNTLREMELIDLQNILFGAMKTFRNFCKQHGLRYFLAEGTLLGAVRHKGFIPWDNDADIFMPYADLQKLISLFKDDDRYVLVHWSKNPDYRRLYARLTDTSALSFEGRWLQYQIMCAGIDIFPIGGYPADKEEYEKRVLEIYKQNALWNCLALETEKAIYSIEAMMNAFAEIESEKYKDGFDDAEYIGMYHIASSRTKPWVVPKKCFSQSTPLIFEGEEFDAPIGYDEYLTARYGDYMTLPPESERFTHEWDSYWNN